MKYCNTCQKELPLSHFHRRGTSGYQPKCKTCKKEWSRRRYEKSREHILKNNEEWRKRNAERMQELRERFNRKHPKYMTYYRALCRVKVETGGLPKWVDLAALKEVYAACPDGMEVDHIIPLHNKLVCGLHVPWNLQYLTPSENRRKGNTFNI